MSLTLGLSTALSGLITSQRGLDVVAQNIANVNTVGYNRKVSNQESVVLNRAGAGVQTGTVTRMVSESLLKSIRAENTELGELSVKKQYYAGIDNLFGEPGADTSVSHMLNKLFNAFEELGANASSSAVQWSTVQSAKDVTDRINDMSAQLQALRSQADTDIGEQVSRINAILTDLHGLNQTIIKNSAVATGTADLEDKRDALLTELSGYMDITYYKRNDGGVSVYLKSGGQALVESRANLLSYSPVSTVNSTSTASGGHFSGLRFANGSGDLTGAIKSGELGALLEMRDQTLPDLQSNVDELSSQMRKIINQVHNAGTSFPNIKSSYSGTRTFANQFSVTSGTSASLVVSHSGGTANLSGTWAAVPGSSTQVTLTSAAPFPGSIWTPNVISVTDGDFPGNGGTYKVVANNGNQLVLERTTPPQTISLTGAEDVAINLFDKNGKQIATTTLREIMQADMSSHYNPATINDGRSDMDYTAKSASGPWTINAVSSHIESWMKSQGFANASVGLNAEGKMIMDTGDQNTSLTFRDQVSSTKGADATTASIKFDVDGDGTSDQTIGGFSAFFGLNDLFITDETNNIHDSQIKNPGFKTSAARNLKLYDETGKVGNTIVIPPGSDLNSIAAAINRQSNSTESTALSTTSFNLTTAATITVTDSSGNALSPVTIGPGNVSLEEIAAKLNGGTVRATIIKDDGATRLQLTDSRGEKLNVSITNGTVAGTGMTLEQTLGMHSAQRVKAMVVNEGSGQKLRITQSSGSELFLASDYDGTGENLLSELGLTPAAAGTGERLNVRSDLISSPAGISRGQVQWNADKGEYYVSEGDNSGALALANAMSQKITTNASGTIAAGGYTLASYAAETISVTANKSATVTERHDYQNTLNESLSFQIAAYSGVNLDVETAAMLDFQASYNASAKVISVIQEMLEVLTGMIR